MKKGLRCRLGFHKWKYLEGTPKFAGAIEECQKCGDARMMEWMMTWDYMERDYFRNATNFPEGCADLVDEG